MANTQYTALKDLEGYFTQQQVAKMIDAAETTRDRMLILLLWRTGRRISEVLLLKKKHIDFYKDLIKFRILKKKVKEYYKLKPIDAGTTEELKKYCVHLDDESYLFPSPYKADTHLTRQQAYNIIRKTAEDAGIFSVGLKPPHPHNLRHSFAIHFLRNTTSPTIAIKVLQLLLEHSNLNITSTYLQFSQEDIKDQLNLVFKVKKERS